MRKNILKRFVKDINFGFGFSMLPLSIFNLYYHILIRYFIIYDIICIILVLFGYKIINKLFLFYFILPLSFLMLIYLYM